MTPYCSQSARARRRVVGRRAGDDDSARSSGRARVDRSNDDVVARARGLERSRWTNEDAGGDARDGDDADKAGVDVEAKDAFDGDSGRRTRGGGGGRTAEGGRASRVGR